MLLPKRCQVADRNVERVCSTVALGVMTPVTPVITCAETLGWSKDLLHSWFHIMLMYVALQEHP